MGGREGEREDPLRNNVQEADQKFRTTRSSSAPPTSSFEPSTMDSVPHFFPLKALILSP